MGDVRKLVDALRAAGVTVHEWAGWDGRTNDPGVTQIQIKGAILHHTATPYGSAFAGLVSSTRSDMRGAMLCNFAGNSDGSLTVIGSGVAWHAGGGFGPNQGPLAPYANRRNYYTVGLEIVYPGNAPMTDAQYKTAVKFTKVVADVFAGGDVEYVRGHYEVNGRGYEGKWDPGYAPGQNIDMNALRSQARSVVTNPIEEVEPMFAVINLPATPEGVVYEQVIGLPDVGGATGFSERYVHLHVGNKDSRVVVAHWQLNNGGIAQMVPDGSVIKAKGRTAGVLAPADAHSLIVDYTAELGLSVVIEAK